MRMFSKVIYFFVATIIASQVLAADKSDGVKIGDPAPVFEAVDNEGKIWNSTHHVGMKYMVVYFCPGDFKFCSIRQAQKYQARLDELATENVQVIGVSGDTPDTHQMFKETHGIDFTLLSDGMGAIATQFGVPLRKGSASPITDIDGRAKTDSTGQTLKAVRGVTHHRWTFIIRRDGTIIYKNERVSPVKDCEDVLEFIKNLKRQPIDGNGSAIRTAKGDV